MSFCLHSLNKVLISELFGGFCDSTDEPWLQFFVLIEAFRPLDVTIAEYLARCEYFHPSHLKEWRANTENLHDFSFFIRVLISSWGYRGQRPFLNRPLYHSHFIRPSIFTLLSLGPFFVWLVCLTPGSVFYWPPFPFQGNPIVQEKKAKYSRQLSWPVFAVLAAVWAVWTRAGFAPALFLPFISP